MKFGVCIPHYGRPIEIDRLTEMAVKAEESGYDSVWVHRPHHRPPRYSRPTSGDCVPQRYAGATDSTGPSRRDYQQS